MTSALTIATEGLLQETSTACSKVEVVAGPSTDVVAATAQPSITVSSKADIVVVSPRKRTRFYPQSPCS